ncbi:MAG: hypothetical protein QOH60_708 [Mycobacterium sp.]|nr:hypothetical protein [Mycobacterium sp.]
MALSDIPEWMSAYSVLYPRDALVVGYNTGANGEAGLYTSPESVFVQGGNLGDSEPLDGSTLFEIGSTTKLFTTGIFIQQQNVENEFPANRLDSTSATCSQSLNRSPIRRRHTGPQPGQLHLRPVPG